MSTSGFAFTTTPLSSVATAPTVSVVEEVLPDPSVIVSLKVYVPKINPLTVGAPSAGLSQITGGLPAGPSVCDQA